MRNIYMLVASGVPHLPHSLNLFQNVKAIGHSCASVNTAVKRHLHVSKFQRYRRIANTCQIMATDTVEPSIISQGKSGLSMEPPTFLALCVSHSRRRTSYFDQVIQPACVGRDVGRLPEKRQIRFSRGPPQTMFTNS